MVQLKDHNAVVYRLQQKVKARAAKSKASIDPITGKCKEYGGPKGLEPTRYNDWEAKGLTKDF